jgi:lysophospholipase L1-like esterase
LSLSAAAWGNGAQPALRHRSYVPAGLRPSDAVRLIVLGDSIGVGRGASDPGLAYAHLLQGNDPAAWPKELATSLTAKYGHRVEMVNVAARFATTNSLPEQTVALERLLPPPVKGHSIVTITIGGNDLFGTAVALGDPTPELLDSAVGKLHDLICWLQDVGRFPDGASIYLMAVYDPTDGAGQAAQCFFGVPVLDFVRVLDAWRDRYVQLGAQLGVAVIDALGAFHGHGFHHDDAANPYYRAADPSLWFAPDCLHPNDRGHNELRRLFFEAIDGSYAAAP